MPTYDDLTMGPNEGYEARAAADIWFVHTLPRSTCDVMYNLLFFVLLRAA